MHISQISINRPVATAMFFLAVILIGVISLFQLPVDLLPDLSYPRITIWTAVADMGPREVEEMITNPIEEAIGTVANIRRTHSVSRSGLSLVTVEFLWGTNMDFATLSIREKLDQLRWILPREVERPNILRIDPRGQPIMAISLSGSNLVHLKELAQNVFKRRMEQIDGVAMATVTGGLDREIQVEVDQTVLQALNLRPENIARALELANYSISGGTVKKGLYRYSLRTLGEFQTVSEIERVVVANNPDGSQIRIRDIARVIDGFRERQSITRFNNEESIGLILRKDAGANTVIVSRMVHRVLDQLRQEYPALNISVAFDGARFISSAISNVMQNLILGAILAFLVLFVFLHDFRNPINIALSIPISVIATFSLLYFSGISLNIMSIGGLALGVGMLVDNSIIVMENIFRYRELGRLPEDAAFLGAKEVAMPISASTLTTIAIFLPVVYLYGVAGQLFRDQAVTVIFSLLASLIVALTLLPMLSCRFRPHWQPDHPPSTLLPQQPPRIRARPWCWILNPLLWLGFYIRQNLKQGQRSLTHAIRRSIWALSQQTRRKLQPIFRFFDTQLKQIYDAYHRLLVWTLANRPKFLIAVLIIFAIGTIAALRMNRQLMPLVDQGEFTIRLLLPVGSTLEATEQASSQIEKYLVTNPNVAAVFSTIGISEDQAAQMIEEAAVNRAKIQVRLQPNRSQSTAQIIAAVRQYAANFPQLEIAIDSGEHIIQQVLGSSAPPVVIKVRGADFGGCRMIADSLKQKFSNISGLKDLHLDYVEGQPEYRIEIDREKAGRYGFSVKEIANFIKYYLAGQQATEFKDFDRKIAILVRPPLSQRDNLNDLLNLPISASKISIPLRELITVTPSFGPSEIRHEEQNRQISLLANLKGRSLSAVIQDIQQHLAQVQVPTDYQILIGGEQEEVYRSFRSLILAMLLAVVLIYMIMAAQFESLRYPFIILLDIPLTLASICIIFWITGFGLNVISFIGLIVLAGIAVNDSIVKVDFINQRRREGASVREAIFDASEKRFRPIIMTSITTILGLLPMAIGFGEGAELQRPLAIATLLGLFISTIVTLLAVPVFYTYLAGEKSEG